MSKKILVKQNGPSVFQTVGATGDRPSFMDFANTAFAGRGKVGVGQRLRGFAGMAGKGAAAAATGAQTMERMQAGDYTAPLQAGVSFQGVDPTGTFDNKVGQKIAIQQPQQPQQPPPNYPPPAAPQQPQQMQGAAQAAQQPPVSQRLPTDTGVGTGQIVGYNPDGTPIIKAIGTEASQMQIEDFLKPQEKLPTFAPYSPEGVTVQSPQKPYNQMLNVRGNPYPQFSEPEMASVPLPKIPVKEGEMQNRQTYNKDKPPASSTGRRGDFYARKPMDADWKAFTDTVFDKLGPDMVYKMTPHQIGTLSAYMYLKLS